jgi:hypothetical protein
MHLNRGFAILSLRSVHGWKPIFAIAQRSGNQSPQTFPRMPQIDADRRSQSGSTSAFIREIRGEDRPHVREFLPVCEDFGVQ